jgi:hypothetical protein
MNDQADLGGCQITLPKSLAFTVEAHCVIGTVVHDEARHVDFVRPTCSGGCRLLFLLRKNAHFSDVAGGPNYRATRSRHPARLLLSPALAGLGMHNA